MIKMKKEKYKILGGSVELEFTDEEIRTILKNLGYTIEMGRDTTEVPYGLHHIIKEVDCEVAYKKGTRPANYLKVFGMRMNHLGNRFWKELSEGEYVKNFLKQAILTCKVDKEISTY